MKNFIFGDTGGHASQLFATLEDIGVNMKTYEIPEDVRIIHLGDIIHKGPSPSIVLLSRIDKLIRRNPGHWIQILGNHEFQHIAGAPRFWRCDCSSADIGILNKWHNEAMAFPTWGLNSFKKIKLEVSDRPKLQPDPSKGIFFSHAGLTHGWWDKFGNREVRPEQLSLALNILPVDAVTFPGELLGGDYTELAGPVWAVGNTEVFNSWTKNPQDDMPFMQFHGHTTSYSFSRGRWWTTNTSFKPFRAATKLNPENRTVLTELNNNILVGIDPGYSVTADTKKQPCQFFES